MWKFWDKTLSYKTFTKLLIIMLLSILCASCVINYFADIYGLRSTQGKYAWYLASSKNALYKPRIEAQASYYMIGTSRTNYIDYAILSKYLNAHVIKIGIAGANAKEMIFLAEKVKANGGSFLLGFDTGSLKANRKSYNAKRLESAFKWPNFVWFNLADTARFIRHILYARPYNLYFTEMDATHFKHQSYDTINEDFKKGHYKNYATSQDDILTLAKLADSKDIFIIFPKYAPYYALFQQYHDPNNPIEQQYFQALRLLVKNTKARVISFYGINEITLEKDNFDDYGWHFKPKIGNLIMARIFDDKSVKLPPNFGVWLDKDNIESYLETMHNDIAANMEMLKGL